MLMLRDTKSIREALGFLYGTLRQSDDAIHFIGACLSCQENHT
jgi:hypothetical protein